MFHVYKFGKERESGRELLIELRDRRPPDVSRDTWEWATGWAITAYLNVCFSTKHVSLEEMKKFRADLEDQLRGPVNLITIDWIWYRLGQTGPHGLSYQQSFESQYRVIFGAEDAKSTH